MNISVLEPSIVVSIGWYLGPSTFAATLGPLGGFRAGQSA